LNQTYNDDRLDAKAREVLYQSLEKMAQLMQADNIDHEVLNAVANAGDTAAMAVIRKDENEYD
jgi:hypothetical protein